jgi:hypothetical protein
MEGRSMDVDWQTDLDRWLAPFVAALGQQDEGADVSSLYRRTDWSRRP